MAEVFDCSFAALRPLRETSRFAAAAKDLGLA
jgi:hypothetical protein